MNTLPKLFLFSGFLGSGKPTLLNLTARYVTEKGYKIAMIINEAGETGVDNLYMKKKGYAVRELFGGCICCTLAQNLKEMVLELNERYSLDAILMEPSGTASPKALYKPLCQAGYGGDPSITFLSSILCGQKCFSLYWSRSLRNPFLWQKASSKIKLTPLLLR